MSAPTAMRRAASDARRTSGRRAFRGAALACTLVLTASYVSVLDRIAGFVGDPAPAIPLAGVVGNTAVIPVAVAAVLVATVVATYVRERTAIGATLVLTVVGHVWYLQSTPATLGVVINAWGVLVSDAVALLTGVSVVRLSNAGAWAVGSVPAPAFLSWYLAVRRRYVASAAIGGATLLVFVLTGDAGTLVTLAGVLGAAGAVGFGDLERRGAPIDQADALAAAFAAMAVLSLTVSVVPAGGGNPTSLQGPGGASGGSGGDTIEGAVVQSSGGLQIGGSVSLSPEVRFTVESEEPGYWRTAVFDQFSGRGWYTDVGVERWNGDVTTPPGPTESIEQVYEVESATSAMPAVTRPSELSGDVADGTYATPYGTLIYEDTFQPGDAYRVTSLRPDASTEELRQAGDSYPGWVQSDFLQVPAGQPDRVGELANEVTADAETPYDAAVAIERYLESEKEYSLDADRPEGNAIDDFLFEMDAGYCVHFASTMAVMLREAGIPARMASGYSTGQQVGEDRYVVRGLNAHAWVEVYFPGEGWVTFDPTPSDGRQQARENRVQTARSAGNPNVDTDESRDGDPTQFEDEESETTPSIDESPDNETDPENATENGTGNLSNDSNPTYGDDGEDDEGGLTTRLPSYRTIGIGLIALFGAAALARRTGHAARFGRAVAVRWQGRGRSPREDVERAFERLELLFAGADGPRSPGETPREYLDRVAGDRDDERVERVRRLYERARYGGEVTDEEAAEAVDLVDALVADESRFSGSNR
ncbi:transglutaminase TgpA family protein [Natronoarchaeum rubrum]|uniref:transglutaminase TgpA family protein n=1 Tax=Natronoarchaeum rubrum TaxID=755311 RepID=UPI002111D117|nr:transglutaminaseTgpA domain-containing protein [Natronoarchaeum rubrum]